MDPIAEAVAWLGAAVSVVTLARFYVEWRERSRQSDWERRQTKWIESDHGQLMFGSWVQRYIERKGSHD